MNTLNRSQFAVLSALVEGGGRSVRELAATTGLSLGTISSVLRGLKELPDPAVSESGEVTGAGLRLLEPYRVKNAVIMAAGLSSRFAPISYEKPKGLFTVRGEVLVERQIRQLKEAGIDEIYLVLGYKKEEFFYLEDEMGVHIRINNEYLARNNNSTIKCVEDVLDNTYICSSDDYFTSNPFEPYVFQSYYSGVYAEGATEEYCFTMKGRENGISSVSVGGSDAWQMMGHVYWDRSFSRSFVSILNAVYDAPETASKLWEDIYIDHLKDLPMVVRKYDPGVIWEFDSLDEVSAFDPTFIQNVDSSILDNICEVLECDRSEISGVVPIKQGLTNLSFRFTVRGEAYVYRHSGEGADAVVNRQTEAFSKSEPAIWTPTIPASSRMAARGRRYRGSSKGVARLLATIGTRWPRRPPRLERCTFTARPLLGLLTCSMQFRRSCTCWTSGPTWRSGILERCSSWWRTCAISWSATNCRRACATTISTTPTSWCAETRGRVAGLLAPDSDPGSVAVECYQGV